MTALLALAMVLGQRFPSPGVNVQDEGGNKGFVKRLNFAGPGVTVNTDAGTAYIEITSGGGGGAPTDATYVTQTCSGSLSAEQCMSALGTGLVKNTTSTGVQSIYAGTSCTNQFPRSLNASGAATCASVVAADISGAVGTASALASNPSPCGANQWVTDTAADGTLTCSQPAFSNISGSVTDSQVPNNITVDLATAATALASDPADCSGNNFALGVNTSGTASCAQPAFSNLSGTASVAQGGTGAAPGAGDQVLVSDSVSAATWRTLTTCTGTGKAVTYDAASNTWGCNTISSPNFVQANLTLTGAGVFSQTVTGQSWVQDSSVIVCMAEARTSAGTPPESVAFAGLEVSISTRVVATGFTVWVKNAQGLAGDIVINCTGA